MTETTHHTSHTQRAADVAALIGMIDELIPITADFTSTDQESAGNTFTVGALMIGAKYRLALAVRLLDGSASEGDREVAAQIAAPTRPTVWPRLHTHMHYSNTTTKESL